MTQRTSEEQVKSPLYARAGPLWPKTVGVATPGNSPHMEEDKPDSLLPAAV